MNQENKALIAKAKLYIDRANDLDPEGAFAEDAVYVDSTGLSGRAQDVVGKDNIYEGHKSLYLVLEEGHWDVRKEDYVETKENVVEFFINATLLFKGSNEPHTFKGVERIEFNDEGKFIHVSGAGFFSQERTRLS